MLNRREVILTQLCTIKKMQGKNLVESAMKQLPVIMKALEMESVTEQEVSSLVVELESSRTEIALKLYSLIRFKQKGQISPDLHKNER